MFLPRPARIGWKLCDPEARRRPKKGTTKGKGAAAGTSSRASLEETYDVHGARVASSGKPLVEPTQRKAPFVLIAAPADHDAVAAAASSSMPCCHAIELQAVHAPSCTKSVMRDQVQGDRARARSLVKSCRLRSTKWPSGSMS